MTKKLSEIYFIFSDGKCLAQSRSEAFMHEIQPFATRWQDKSENVEKFKWNFQILDASYFLGESFLAQSNVKMKPYFKTDIQNYFIDSGLHWKS